MDEEEISPADLATCLRVLAKLRPGDPAFVAVERAAAHLRKEGQKTRKRQRRNATTKSDRAALEAASRVRAYHGGAVDEAGATRILRRERNCYVCKAPFTELHGHYHSLCRPCAERNWLARTARADLEGRRALVTGGRIKIGYRLALKLLRDGAHVVVTTRFPDDAARRYALEPDFDAFADRLEIHGLDLLQVQRVVEWIDAFLARDMPLDILVNNAAQTIRRPPDYYATLAGPDEGGVPLDLSITNSWIRSLAEIEPVEAVEVLLVNAAAPFILASRLKPAMLRSAWPDRYIVNVSAMEGKFDRVNRTTRHPHTNMAKAALNMMTRTAHDDYARYGIYMNSVDTGWITQENPLPKRRRLEAGGFVPPLDAVDGAARIYDPIVRGVLGAPIHGMFLKDYEPVTW